MNDKHRQQIKEEVFAELKKHHPHIVWNFYWHLVGDLAIEKTAKAIFDDILEEGGYDEYGIISMIEKKWLGVAFNKTDTKNGEEK